MIEASKAKEITIKSKSRENKILKEIEELIISESERGSTVIYWYADVTSVDLRKNIITVLKDKGYNVTSSFKDKNSEQITISWA